jgi:hypothetical protein
VQCSIYTGFNVGVDVLDITVEYDADANSKVGNMVKWMEIDKSVKTYVKRSACRPNA